MFGLWSKDKDHQLDDGKRQRDNIEVEEKRIQLRKIIIIILIIKDGVIMET